jgi:beta-glucanase (GH16 family)
MTAIDIKKTMVQSFNEDFNTLSLYTDSKGNTSCNPGGKGVWQTVYHFCSRTIPSNSEAQIYIDQNFISYMNSRASTPSNTEVPFSLKAGILSITAKPSDGALRLAAGSWAGYTSGLLTTEFSFSQTYGYFEIKAKLPKGEGVWPAFWLLPVDRSWPPEIDVVETFGGTNEKGEGGATHIHYASHLKEKSKSCGEWFDVQKNVTNGFHTYGVNWQPDKITYYFDNLPYASCPGSPEANKPFYMLVNLAVGGKGSWPGTTDESNVWPAIMQVDFIRAYKNK